MIGVTLDLGERRKVDVDLLSLAVDAAKYAGITIVFVSNPNAWDWEGRDKLPADGSQVKLISAVAEDNANTIVVGSTGVPIAMLWLPKIKAFFKPDHWARKLEMPSLTYLRAS